MCTEYGKVAHMPVKTRRLTISLPDDLIEKVDRMAEGQQRTRSNTIARLIQLYKETP